MARLLAARLRSLGILTGIPPIKPTFLDIAPGGIPPNIIPYSKGVKCGLMRPDSLKVPAFIGQPLCCLLVTHRRRPSLPGVGLRR